VVRSEFDDILFQHARECGTKVFDGVKVNALQFEVSGSQNCQDSGEETNLGHPVSATWTDRKKTSGTIYFKYLVDATGRAGLVSTKYMKNRRYNEGLKNIATWGYFEGTGTYGIGTPGEGGPFFPRLQGRSKILHCCSI
jgi:flavin-dependent dehydrogenase